MGWRIVRSRTDRVDDSCAVVALPHDASTRMYGKISFGLSSREKKLLRRFASGKTDVEIAHELGDREERIAAQRQRIREKLQIQTDEQLVVLAGTLARWPNRRRQELE